MEMFVIDTNVFVSSLSNTSRSHWIIEGLVNEHFAICISNEILLEYEEVLSSKYSKDVALNFLMALEELPNVIKTEVHFHWNLLDDPDDNKFVDAAVAGGASWIVSEDRHFRVLDKVEFPKIHLLRISDFAEKYTLIKKNL